VSDAYDMSPLTGGLAESGAMQSIVPSASALSGLSGPISMGGGAGGLASMLGPLSIASPLISAGSSAIQGIMGFVSGQQQAKQAAAAAIQASRTGGINADERLQQGGQIVGRAATLAASSGGGLGGTTAGVLNHLAETSMFNARAMAYRGATEADADTYQSSIDKDNAMNSLIGGFTGAAGQAVTGALKAGFRQQILSSKAYQTGEIDPLAASYLG
jgi:hypothetical protein